MNEETIKKSLYILTFAIIIITGATYLTYAEGKNATTNRMSQAAPYESTSLIITPDYTMSMVSHTEYQTGEAGRIITRLVDNQGNPIIVNNCNATIKNPDNSAFATNVLMSATNIPGNYEYDFTTPSTTGVYEYIATCTWSPNKAQSATSSFHVSPALNTINVINATLNAQGAFNTAMNSNVTQNNLILKNVTTTALQIYNDTEYLKSNMLTSGSYAQNFTDVENNINSLKTNLTKIIQFCNGAPTSDSALCQMVTTTNQTLASMTTTLSNLQTAVNVINSTTTTTYTYVTTTLYNKVNNIFGIANDINTTITGMQGTLGSISADVNATRRAASDANNTASTNNAALNTILGVLNNQTSMTVTSG